MPDRSGDPRAPGRSSFSVGPFGARRRLRLMEIMPEEMRAGAAPGPPRLGQAHHALLVGPLAQLLQALHADDEAEIVRRPHVAPPVREQQIDLGRPATEVYL